MSDANDIRQGIRKRIARTEQQRRRLAWWLFYGMDEHPAGASRVEPADLLQNRTPEQIEAYLRQFLRNEEMSTEILKRTYPDHAAEGAFD